MSTRIQAGILSAQNSSEGRIYVFHTTAQGPEVPPGARMSRVHAMTFLLNVDIDGHGPWEIVGGDDTSAVFKRTINKLVLGEMVQFTDHSGKPAYRMTVVSATGSTEGATDSGTLSQVPAYVEDPVKYLETAFTSAILCAALFGWIPDEVVPDLYQGVPKTLRFWRPTR